jgi:hypothetical protein
MERDFNKWLIGKPNWAEIAFLYNTKQKYQHKQDLVALFWNSYVYIEDKAKTYFTHFLELPIQVLNDIIFEFRQHFPLTGRIEGINYYDDLINQLVEKYTINKDDKLIYYNWIFLKLIGYTGNYNNEKTEQPVYYYIKDVLKEFSISPSEGREIVLQMQGSVSPDWNKNVIPFIVDYLEKITPQSSKKQGEKNINGLSFNEFEKNLYLINWWDNEDENNIKELNNTKQNLVNEYIKPFERELNNNLLLKDTNEAKRDIIKHYIFELFELQGFFNEYREILFCKPDNEGNVRLNNEDDVNTEFEKYVISCLRIYHLIFELLQICCIKYNIDFFKVCNELSFSTEYIDCGITLGFEEM